MAITIVAFANADGGAIAISDKTKRIDGTDYEVEKLNELLRAPYDFCEPSVPVRIERVACIDVKGRENHLVVMHIEPSMSVHANQADEAFLRVGDKSRKLTFEERTQLMYDKGERYFEDKAVPDATMDDIDLELVQDYIEKIDYGKSAVQYLKENEGFVKAKNGEEKISGAAILLFGKNPQLFFPRARIRFIRYEGVEEKTGTEMNVIKDVVFEGTILKMITDSIAFLDTQIKEKTYLGKDGRFVTEEEYPKFVKEYGEGVDRMCRELEEAGLQEPKYYCDAFILKTIIYNADSQKLAIGEEKLAIEYINQAIEKRKYKKPTKKNILRIYESIDANQVFGTAEIVRILGCSVSGARTLMEKMREMQVVCEVKGKGKGKYRFLNKDEK